MFGSQRSIRAAAASGYHDIVKLLLEDERVDPAAYGNFAIRAAAAGGHFATVKCLLDDPRIVPSAHQNQALRLACTYGHVAIVELLLTDERELPSRGTGQALQCACVRGHDAVAERLLADPRVRVYFPTRDARGALQGAAGCGNMVMLERLLADSRITDCPNAIGGALATAAKAGNLPAVDRLLRVPQPIIETYVSNDGGLYYAAEEGHLEVAERLLADPRLNHDMDRILPVCAAGGHVAVLTRLLAHRRFEDDDSDVQDFDPDLDEFDPDVEDDLRDRELLLGAASRGDVAVVEFLLLRLGACTYGVDEAFVRATDKGHVELARLLLNDPRLDPAAYVYVYGDAVFDRMRAVNAGTAALVKACHYGHLEMVELLLADPRLDVEAAHALQCPRSAAEQRRTAVVQCLLSTPRVAAVVPAAEAARFLDEASQPLGVASSSEVSSEERLHCDEAPNAASTAVTPSDLTADKLRAAFFNAASAGDVDALRQLLANPQLDPQEPSHGGHYDYYCDRKSSFALSFAADAGQVAAVDLLLTDPCWEPRHVTDALSSACWGLSSGHAAAVERLLADPRVEVRLVPERDSEPSCFRLAAESGRADFLQLLLAETRMHHLDKAAVGRQIIRGFREMPADVAYDPRRPALREKLGSPPILHACVAATTTETPPPAFIRNAIDVHYISDGAWARRKRLVAARVRALDEE